ncbi:MAG: ErfK/YbiS/YcfS/YnhG family [uncultured bacterium]|nr:MAG: ErfK/YbiS/YcfS/YnhG family [uncultured bacterium]
MKKLVLLSLLFFLLSASQVLAAEVVDTDKDGLIDDLEVQLGTGTDNPDTDNDGYKDGEEVANGYNPLVGDRDRNVTRSVEVNLDKQQMNFLFNGIKIGVAPVSTGVIGKDTPVGEFDIFRKIPVARYKGPGYDLPNTKWNLEFKKTYYLHGAYWHNQFGKKAMSHGCVNIAYVNAEKLYKFLQVGDSVKIFGKTPRGIVVKDTKLAKE